jgi:hypothetical protein
LEHDKFGIYLNVNDRTVMRISSPYWIPSEDEWVLVTPDVNATLLNIRALIGKKGLASNPDEVVWGDWSQVPRRD